MMNSSQIVLSQVSIPGAIPDKSARPPILPGGDVYILGIESSCDETGVAIVHCTQSDIPRLRGHALHSQVDMHQAYGGVVPELASRDHVRRVLPLLIEVLAQSGLSQYDINHVAFTQGPGLAGALLVGAGVAAALAAVLEVPLTGIHHLEGHLLSAFLSTTPPEFPFIALLVSGGHTQLMKVTDVGCYETLGETIDDAAGEAFDKSAKLMGLGYPGGAALSKMAEFGQAGRFSLPRPLMHSTGFDFSFAGLKTAVRSQFLKLGQAPAYQDIADLASATEQAIVDILVHKAKAALYTSKIPRLVVAGGVGANRYLRFSLNQACEKIGVSVHYPEPALCTDNGAMIALAAGMRWQRNRLHQLQDDALTVFPRWPLGAVSE